MQMALQHAFGIRMRESATLKPHGADKGTYLSVNWGTKGGRPRTLPIENDYQRQVLDQAKKMVTGLNDSLMPKEINFEAWRNHYYYVCRQVGITRKNGITSHGLRHENFNKYYEKILGVASPVCGGDLSGVDSEKRRFVMQEIADRAGHVRKSISRKYLG